MKLFLFLIFCLCATANGFSQTINSIQEWTTSPQAAGESSSNDAYLKRLYNKKEGHVYLFDSWERPALIISSKDGKLMLKNINFNIEENRFETETDNGSLFIFHNKEIKSVEISDVSFIKMINPMTNKATFFETLFLSNKIAFYKMPELLISKGVLNPLTQELSPDVISKKMVYFYTKNNSNLIEIELKKKSILNKFADKKNEISDFVKDNKLDYGSEQDVVKIITYYNSLL